MFSEAHRSTKVTSQAGFDAPSHVLNNVLQLQSIFLVRDDECIESFAKHTLAQSGAGAIFQRDVTSYRSDLLC